MNTVPQSLRKVDKALEKMYKFALALVARGGLSDANITSGDYVAKLIETYDNEVKGLVQKSIDAGVNWGGFDERLSAYVESFRGIYIVDQEEGGIFTQEADQVTSELNLPSDGGGAPPSLLMPKGFKKK